MFKKLKLEFGYCLYTDSIQSKSFCEDCSENLYQYTKKECSLKERIKWYKEYSLAVKDMERNRFENRFEKHPYKH
jgi:hypothetical protein